MIKVHHLNCVKIVSPVNDNVCGHCLLLESENKLVLIDTGISLLDVKNPVERIGQQLIDMVGYSFNENQTAIKQIENLGLDPKKVTDCIISHFDNDHLGGIADFPEATIHIGAEEFESYKAGNPRYLQMPLLHNPPIKVYEKSTDNWFGFEARKVTIDIDAEIFLIPLFGHTIGHCGVAVKANDKCIFYVADAYYMKIELTDSSHPVNKMAQMRAENNDLRLSNLEKILQFTNEHPDVEVFGYHDIEEFNSHNEA